MTILTAKEFQEEMQKTWQSIIETEEDKLNPDTFIRFKKGGAHIEGGLIFHSKQWSIYRDNDAVGSCENCYFYMGEAPKWWQFRKWWEIIQLVRRFTRKP